jgi:outer membrane receptor protein involved in Fe transport
MKLNLKPLSITGQLSSQFVQDLNDTLIIPSVFKMNPFIQIESKELIQNLNFSTFAFYRNSFRMPSFNELYYNSIGNNKLKPEEANQLSLGFVLNPKIRKLSIVSRTNCYFNQVRNKIVAIPTKNLFVWSMQNVGKVNVLGAESTLELVYKFNDKWNINSTLNYTIQIATDITERSTPTFGHQIAYIPKHTFNADISVKRENTGFKWSTFGNSLRYSLNENNSANEVAGFIISDVSIFTSVKMKKHDVRIQFSCKNIFNSSYAIMRYYVMPGRNYLISLNYAFN